ncbi:MAG: eCIS core domain-containing protein [Actinomycetales bacterium]
MPDRPLREADNRELDSSPRDAVRQQAVREQAVRPQGVAGPRRETGGLEQLQSEAGNAAVVAMLAGAQRALAVGHAYDPAELEADRISRAVVSALASPSSGAAAHSCAVGCSHDADGIARQTVQRETVRRAAIGLEGGDLDGDAESRVRGAMSGGSPLPEVMRAPLESAMGADFSGVRVHSDGQAADLAKSMSAKAFTLGGHIFLGEGAKVSDTALMAHELTHTIQQGASRQQTED